MELDQIISDIKKLNHGEISFDSVDVGIEQQRQRGKPLFYLQAAAKLLEKIGGQTIIEIGCMRKPIDHPIEEIKGDCCIDGHSTFFWGKSGKHVISLDIDKKAVKNAQQHCKIFKNVKVHRKDGIGFLKNYSGTIDLLFLDAWDVIPNTEYAENHLLAYLAAKQKLAKKNIIIIDDTDIAKGGKGRLLIPVLEADGYSVLVQGRQTIAINF